MNGIARTKNGLVNNDRAAWVAAQKRRTSQKADTVFKEKTTGLERRVKDLEHKIAQLESVIQELNVGRISKKNNK